MSFFDKVAPVSVQVPSPAPLVSSVSTSSSGSGSVGLSASLTNKPKRLAYFSSNEVATHATEADCWLSILGRVYNLTTLLSDNKGILAKPIIQFAGQDISHWFNPETGDLKTYIDPQSNLESPYLPYGRFIHTPPREPVSNWSTDFGTPWWKDYDKYVIGLLSSKPRPLRIVNTLSGQDDQLEVCNEETLDEIRARYIKYNLHCSSYTWKFNKAPLNMTKTLDENGVAEEFGGYVPAILLYFNDDLTVA